MIRIPKSFQRRLKESNDNSNGTYYVMTNAAVSELDELSDYMSSLSTDIKGKDEKIRMLGLIRFEVIARGKCFSVEEGIESTKTGSKC